MITLRGFAENSDFLLTFFKYKAINAFLPFPTKSGLGVIQIIRDTRREGVDKVSQILFLLFKTQFSMPLEGKCFITKQDKASKDTFLQIHLIFQSNLSLKSVIKN
jgi:hypothetical protein